MSLFSELCLKGYAGQNAFIGYLNHQNLSRLCKICVAYVSYYTGLTQLMIGLQNIISPLRGIKILTYHRVNGEEQYNLGLTISVSNFERQIRYLKMNCNILSLQEAVQILNNGQKIPPKSVAITFDDGYEDNYVNAFPILKRYGIPATIFLSVMHINNGTRLWVDQIVDAMDQLSGDYLDLTNLSMGVYKTKTVEDKQKAIYEISKIIKKSLLPQKKKVINYLETLSSTHKFKNPMLSWEQIKEMKNYGISFGSHCMNHFILTKIPIQDAAFEIIQSKKVLEDKLGKEISFFAYPNGSMGDFNDQIIELLKDAGYSCACTLISGSNRVGVNLYELKRRNISEQMSTGLFGRFSTPIFGLHMSNIPSLFKLEKRVASPR